MSQSDMNHALKLIDLNLGERGIEGHKWCCVVIQNTHNGGALPEGYLCTTVESILPNATALVYNDAIVAYCLIKNEGHRQAEICDPLQAYLADMGFKAGISRTFLDSFHARDYYRQALATLETGFECDPDRSWYLFGDYALDYMLLRCCGEFSTEMMVPPELVRLYRRSSTDVDYIETLRTFLDNDCRITQTANVLYLHRTTMVKRLEKMREHVNLDDPDRRLYLRMCLHLPDIEQTLEACSDVS
jgi:sugar diacid utilization regulator